MPPYKPKFQYCEIMIHDSIASHPANTTYMKHFKIFRYAMMLIARSHFAKNRLTEISIHNIPAIYDIVILRYSDTSIMRCHEWSSWRCYDFAILQCCEANHKITSSQIFRARYSRKVFSLSWHLVMRFNANKWGSC